MNKKMKFSKFICFILIFLLSFSIMPKCLATEEAENSRKEIEDFINNYFNTRNNSFIDGNIENVINKYDLSKDNAKYALDHEVRRLKYLRDWSSERGIKLVKINSISNFKNFTPNDKNCSLRVDEEFIVNYAYEKDEKNINTFGISLFHFINLTKQENTWLISKDWYLDCFEDALKSYDGDFSNSILPDPKVKSHDISTLIRCEEDNIVEVKEKGYDRTSAANYADKYCGVTSLSDNSDKYDKKYPNYTGIGGNCTNFVSQCLGDKEGGHLPQDYTWCSTVKNGKRDSSPSWINADAFKDYILYSGKGKIIKNGDFKNLLCKNEESTKHSFCNLQIGDVVSYSKKGDIDHNAIITGFDSSGYPLINSHTVDRYHVPFDLGWGDKGISFYMIHIK